MRCTIVVPQADLQRGLYLLLARELVLLLAREQSHAVKGVASCWQPPERGA
jgi:hypothetical protein